MTTDQLTRNKHLVESFIQELFTKGDLTAIDRYLAPDFVNHDPPFPARPKVPRACARQGSFAAACPTGAARPTTTSPKVTSSSSTSTPPAPAPAS